MKNPHRALEAIEALVGSDFGMEMEFLLNDPGRGHGRYCQHYKQLRQAARIITDIYMIAHAEGSCGVHPTWQEKKYEILKK